MARRVMCVGLACVDIINVVQQYPVEDTDTRCEEQMWQRGGNASNSCTVLHQLGEKVEYVGTLARSHDLKFLESDFIHHHIHIDHCVRHADCTSPISTIISNRSNGSRTILHGNRNLPELTHKDFLKIDLSQHTYKWIHFECRPNEEEMEAMLRTIAAHNSSTPADQRITVSVKFEKVKCKETKLLPLADYVFLGKEFCEGRGCHDMKTAVTQFVEQVKEGCTVICPWGEQGAAALTNPGSAGEVVSSPAYPPPKLVDTLGAGDTFVAAMVTHLSRGNTVEAALRFGCLVAGAKCGMQGYAGLGERFGDGATDSKDKDARS